MIAVTATLFEGASLRILSITGEGNDSVLLRVRGIPKGAHRIQASVDLSVGSFIDIATVIPPMPPVFFNSKIHGQS